jgi:hypothetical protein
VLQIVSSHSAQGNSIDGHRARQVATLLFGEFIEQHLGSTKTTFPISDLISLADLAFFLFDHLRVLIFHGLEELKTGLQVFDLGAKL